MRFAGVLSVMAVFLLVEGFFMPPAILAGDSPDSPTESISVFDTRLVYVSDYVSFIGWDDHGYVAFALDTNRGRDGESWQAEHFVVLHDQRRGWISLDGNGSYENSTKALARIPSSANFRFRGSPENGLTISSLSNSLELTIQPIPIRLSRTQEGAEY